jgi:membrane-associated phospholipid phosphatase
VVGDRYALGLRDPDGVIGTRLLLVFALVGGFWALDVIPRGWNAARAAGRPKLDEIRKVARERWSLQRGGVVFGLIVAFYVTYLCYRNVKSYVPLARPEIVDGDLREMERGWFGNDPAEILHDLLGTGVTAHALSTVYLLFLTFVPLSVAAALVWRTDMAGGLFWLAVISLNWVLGAASYFLLPSMGPAFVAPELFADLPRTGVTALQEVLLEHRLEFLASPVASGGLQSIAAFASLHVSIVLSGALVAHLLGAPKALRIGLWVFFALTAVATIYFGWHYIVDDIAGVAIALIAVVVGARLTGWKIVGGSGRGLQVSRARA